VRLIPCALRRFRGNFQAVFDDRIAEANPGSAPLCRTARPARAAHRSSRNVPTSFCVWQGDISLAPLERELVQRLPAQAIGFGTRFRGDAAV
jgi:hypothetical protein